MPYYRRVGDVPPTRLTQFRAPDGGLYAEELMGSDGFSGPSALLYHRRPPTTLTAAATVGDSEAVGATLHANRPLLPRHLRSGELPGGGGDSEDAIVASKRELAEETGILAKEWTLLGKTRVCNGLMTEHQSTYLARNLTMTGKKSAEDDVLVRDGKFYTFKEIHKMIGQGKINDGQSLTGLYLAEQWLSRSGK